MQVDYFELKTLLEVNDFEFEDFQLLFHHYSK
jgi:hypothetical protein